jgi:hypothetical protein
MDIKYTIQDNYLNAADYKNLKKIIMGGKFPWYFKSGVVTLKEKDSSHCYWVHFFFSREDGISSPFFKILEPILKKLKVKALMRIKANLYSNQGEIKEHQKHVDFPFKHKGAIFYLNTCNGFTTLADGTKIESVGNRILLFNPSIPHHSSTCTDENTRVNININYF